MSVVGFDIGNFKSSIGIAKQGGIDIVDNEYSDRITPTYVSFQDRVRLQGHSAKQLEVTHSQNTFAGFKRLLGRRFHDPLVQHELQLQPLRISASPQDDKILFNADYMGELKHFTAEQITGMFLTKLKQIAESHMPTKMYDCVVSVPSFMTDTERRALLDAAQIAGLNVLKLMNETTAVALNYGLYNTNLPEVNEKSSLVAFVDMGYTQTQASVVAFNKGKLKVLATAYDNNLGGRDFDRLLMDHFQQEFKDKYKIDAYSNVRARLRLRAECEKVKKVMSSVTSPVPFNIECLMNDKDVSSSLKRDDFEALSLNLLQRFRNVLTDVLTEAHCVPADIDVVEIVGGTTRIPIIKRIIQEVLGKEPSTTLNADEACARGCTLMCAILSPTF
jgi:molecular chaperone DnaK (HSP70)